MSLRMQWIIAVLLICGLSFYITITNRLKEPIMYVFNDEPSPDDVFHRNPEDHKTSAETPAKVTKRESVEKAAESDRKEYIKVADVEVAVGPIVSEVYDHYKVASRENRYMQEHLPTVVKWEHDYMLWIEAMRMVVYLDPNKNDDLSEENRIKIDKVKRYIERHPEKSLVIGLYVRLTDVFEKADIPIEQFRAGWHYYHGEHMPPLTYKPK